MSKWNPTSELANERAGAAKIINEKKIHITRNRKIALFTKNQFRRTWTIGILDLFIFSPIFRKWYGLMNGHNFHNFHSSIVNVSSERMASSKIILHLNQFGHTHTYTHTLFCITHDNRLTNWHVKMAFDRFFFSFSHEKPIKMKYANAAWKWLLIGEKMVWIAVSVALYQAHICLSICLSDCFFFHCVCVCIHGFGVALLCSYTWYMHASCAYEHFLLSFSFSCTISQ